MKKGIISSIFIIALIAAVSSCNFIKSFVEEAEDVRSVSFDKKMVHVAQGAMDIVSLKIDSRSGQSNVSVSWEYDSQIIAAKCDNYGIVITGIKEGSTVVKAAAGGKTAACTVRVLSIQKPSVLTHPYVYTSQDFVSVTPSQTAKIHASIYGLPHADVNGFSFTIDKPSVASIHTEGNYCFLTGMSEGMAKVTARHNKSPYPYTFLVSCTASNTNLPFITSSDNIITINKDNETQKKFFADMVNPPYPTYKDDFVFSVVDETGTPITDPPVTVTKTAHSATVTAIKEGFCYIKITHPSCTYSCDVICRVTKNINNVYIQPSQSYVTVNGSDAQTVTLSLENLDENTIENPDEYEWSFSENAGYYINYNIFGGSENGKGNSIWITGKRNGAAKITVSHKNAPAPKTILVLVRNVVEQAASSKVYITTNQNYIETKVGASSFKINITLHNLDDGSQNDLTWSILHEASDGSKDPVISYENGTGNAISRFARSIISMADGYASIAPLKEGKATISITHPKAAYPAKILVNVLPETTVIPIKLSLSTEKPLVKILNGQTESVTVELSGSGKTEADENAIIWTASDSSFSVSSSGKTAQISANGSGNAKGTLTVTHAKCDNPLSIALIRADTEDDIKTIKTIYADTASYTIFTDDTVQLSVNGTNLEDTDRFTWECDSGLGTVYTFEQHDRIAVVKGLAAGTACIKATLASIQESVNFYIQVKQNGIVDEHKPAYLTTQQNVVTLVQGAQKTIQVNPKNIKTAAYKDIKWQNNNPELFDISANDMSCTISAKNEGQGSITVSHPVSKNQLLINVHIGSEYVHKNTDIAYISTEKDTLLLKTDSGETMFSCVLAHTEYEKTSIKDFTFTGLNNDIFTVNYNPLHNYCLITPKKAGQGLLRISHPQAQYDKEIVVIVEKSKAELDSIPYISTLQNVVTVIKGETVPVTCSLKNANNYDQNLWSWQSNNSSVCNILTNNGNTALINGIEVGSTKIKISHTQCRYPLEIIVICLDSAVQNSLPWIKLSQNIINLKKNDSTTISAEMVNVPSAQSASFIWTVNNPDVALISGRGESCYIKALKKGFTYITCRNMHNPDAYAKTAYLRVEDTVQEECYISTQNKTIKINPTDKTGTTISAQLVNGSPLDIQDFIWWADDNTLVNLIANTDQCSIIPTGIAGTTTVHVKHPKVLQPLDIIVMLSKYDNFAFAQNSKELCEKTMQIIPLQVPAVNGTAIIEYESENPNVCAVTGSNQVCMIAGVAPGYTTVYATLKNENGIIAKTEMAVIVSKKEEAVNTITLNSTVLNMKIGESQTLEALLTGNDITAPDNYNISWQSNNPDVVSLLATEHNETKGKNAYITAKRAGEAVITVSHPKCRFDLQLWVIIPEKEDVTLKLSDSYIEMYKGDGAKVITATVFNGTVADENAIIWTAPKVGGINIISISKSKGKSCNIMPRSVGSTTLRAQLPNGNYADCIVTVKANAEVILETKAVHVNPGYSETIRYTTVPESASINWISMFNGNTGFGQSEQYFSFYANDAAKTITITGHKLGSGNIQGYFASNTGTATATIAVYVEYHYDLQLKNKGVIDTEPRNNAVVEIPFTVYPHNLQIKAEVSDPSVLEVSSISLNENTGEGTVYIKPLKEGISQSVTVIATNPDDLVNTPIRQTQIINSAYKELHITPVFDFASGSYSYFDNNDTNPTLYIGDGEDVLFYLDIAEENATADNIQITYQSNTGVDDCDSQIYTQQDKQEDARLQPYKIGEGRHHIFFSGSENASDPSCGTLQPETVTSDGKKLYRFGHNYDYKKGTGYIVKGKYKFPYKITFWECDAIFSSQGTYIHRGLRHWIKNYVYCFRNNGCDWIEVGNFESYINNRAALIDGNYYFIEKNAFESNKNFYCVCSFSQEKDFITWRGRIGWKQKEYSYSINRSIYPKGAASGKISKDNTVVSSVQGRITIRYTDLNNKVHAKKLHVIIQKRNCEKSTKGFWEKDSIDGVTAWKMVKQDNSVPEQSEFETFKYYRFDTNLVKIKKGESAAVKIVTNAPELFDNAMWSIEDPNIAGITGNKSNAVITAHKQGNSNITVKFKNHKSVMEEKKLPLLVIEPTLYPEFTSETDLSYTLSATQTALTFSAQEMSPEEIKQTTITSNNEKLKVVSLSFSDTSVTVNLEADKGFSEALLHISNPVIKDFTLTIKDAI